MSGGQRFTLAHAVALAFAAHEGQVDKAGRPYIDHPLRVMLKIQDDEARMAAVLHDVLEDSDITVVDLYEQGCPVDVVSAVVALTKRPAEPMEEYLERVAGDRLALMVKYADIADNTDPERLSLLPEEEADRLRGRYAGYTRMLNEFTGALR
jgi:(p)ppGpp synthase/HD superfamily hydrolase